MGDLMTGVLEARQRYQRARAEAAEHVDRYRACLGLAIREARAAGGPGAQTSVMSALKLSREQVRAFEQAYTDWLRDHDGEDPRTPVAAELTVCA